MDILIAAGGMPFGPLTPQVKSLGGSETSAIELAARLSEQGADVTVFAQLPQEGPDAIQHGTVVNGVRWMDLDNFQEYASSQPHDLMIAQRNPSFINFNSQSKKKVLWVHDIATVRGMMNSIQQTEFAIDQIWTVSEWHRQQIHEVTEYPIDNIVALRNGIVAFEDEFYDELDTIERNPTQLFYGARPERGLAALVRPGGIMERLPECHLKIAMYDHFPEHMQDFYNHIFAMVDARPNCEFIGSLSQQDMRRTMKSSVAYVYPTAFEETSCIIARECIETLTPFLSTAVGALPETLGDCGIFYEDWLDDEVGDTSVEMRGKPGAPNYESDVFCESFAQFIRASLTKDIPDSNVAATMWAVDEMTKRTDLYWDGVAEQVLENAEPIQPTPYSRAWSMVQDGDVIAAEAYLSSLGGSDFSRTCQNLYNQLYDCYPFVFGDVTMEDHYNFIYESVNGDELEWTTEHTNHPRINEVRGALKSLAPGSTVLEYGCGAGHMIAPLAMEFPLIDFIGMDINQACVDVINAGAAEHGVENLTVVRGDEDNPVDIPKVDFAWCSEVLEHVIEPWSLIETVESYVEKGGYVLFTVPYGPWEPMTFMRKGQFMFRAHIWEIDKPMIQEMVGEKEEVSISVSPVGCAADGRMYGNYIFSFKVDHDKVDPVDPLRKSLFHRSRQTVAAAVIAMDNSDTIERMLNSLEWTVQHVNIALGPCKDNTREIVEAWFAERKYITYKIIDVPKIHTPEGYPNGFGEGFGFDDARNASTEGLEDYDWILWIDTDEYLVGNFNPFLRSNSLDSYLITQHHFTVEPRGEPAQLDKPARLIRTTSGFTARGHIHEHFEIPDGGPGRGFLLPQVDIGHTGYEDEETRKARFRRNFPFLQWEHDIGTDRRLHPFLWFRDIVHRVRYALMEENKDAAFSLAQEGIQYYNDHWKEMASFGPGTFQALGYVAELNRYMDRGLGVQISLAMEDGKSLSFDTKVEDFEQLQRVLSEVLKPEYERRASRYY